MTKVVYVSTPEKFSWRYVNPVAIFKDLMRYRELIVSMTSQNFRSTYQASYLGVSWQIILPLIMLTLFYFVFGVIMGGRFSQTAIESPLDYALALFVGLGFFNFFAQNLGSSTSLIISNQIYVKSLSFPLEVIPVTNVLNSLLTLIINLLLTSAILLIAKHSLHPSAILAIFYVACIFMLTLGVSWIFSALSVFLRDLSAIVSPLTLILMFMCPIFYPASMVPKKLKWVIQLNPIAVIIEDVRSAMLYGVWPSIHATLFVFAISLFVAITGYFLFMRSKNIFADVI